MTASDNTDARLVADIGGTNVRFALAEPGCEPGPFRAYRVAEHATFEAALERFLSESGMRRVASAAIGAAGPVDNGMVALTNAPWRLAEAGVSDQLHGAAVRIVNDLEAVAHALPYLAAGDVEQIGAVAAPEPRHPLIAVNVGTGFGAASVARTGAGWVARASEAGHMTLAPSTAAEAAAFTGCATVEDVLSGRGMAALYRRLAGPGAAPLAAEEIVARAATDAVAHQALGIAGALLGRIAGDLVLATGAWGGCFLCGSVARGWAEAGDTGAFRSAFERKGAMSGRMSGVYTGIVTRGDAALLGLARMPID